MDELLSNLPFMSRGGGRVGTIFFLNTTFGKTAHAMFTCRGANAPV